MFYIPSLQDDSSKKRKIKNKIISDDEEYVDEEYENVANSCKESGVISENGEKMGSESDTETIPGRSYC